MFCFIPFRRANSCGLTKSPVHCQLLLVPVKLIHPTKKKSDPMRQFPNLQFEVLFIVNKMNQAMGFNVCHHILHALAYLKWSNHNRTEWNHHWLLMLVAVCVGTKQFNGSNKLHSKQSREECVWWALPLKPTSVFLDSWFRRRVWCRLNWMAACPFHS